MGYFGSLLTAAVTPFDQDLTVNHFEFRNYCGLWWKMVRMEWWFPDYRGISDFILGRETLSL